ncbi:hypothetical protein ADN00_09065 [Ornatilinea apprima]|uniref:Uncharacterized protein n=1 Tax=Ornatilinea apprima TaxID=1134406 RepID=A0A0P6XPT6_9CHLR|nr:hypothetical protein [Ornatilinea apprima]KPL77276.1 hypothetical protein ADN00_09065 [Ornatilinea apprima]
MTISHTDSVAIFEIQVKGSLAPAWSDWFAGFDLSSDENGNTIMVGPVIDQAELHGVLERIRDLGLQLLSVRQVTNH